MRTYECRMEPVSDRVAISVVQDMTERADAYRDYVENAARFRAIVHNSSELVVVTDGGDRSPTSARSRRAASATTPSS